ncbi:MAG: PIN domain-containing protein [Rhodanobacter sp.]|nr:MAG: PIN domain-containing protein [Rhodanobacter sp.]TAM13948.1 MAG: PIN domain-containing protein [Rhodanobacter sp.]TAM37790.1 MAG: PIN domain-containing protein [Rhodanobacter sp.]
MTTGVPCVVLDTNVCLDLFVFGDPRAAMLGAALHAHAFLAVTDADCRAEWLRVLTYPQLALATARRAAVAAEFDRWLAPFAGTSETQAPPLPRCADADDQKFLELAQRARACCLLSRDHELLKLAARTRRDHGFDIVTPWDWVGVPAAA